ncbi:MAG: zinc-ribbon domain containing protein [Candidatus Kerfeldbacteria bacterium]|nr:zinc-ribbon domain containing protein [Candidatus Kerfeldbacteria bacterium]
MTKQCQQCSKNYLITAGDQEFYQRINVPEPKLCPDCRFQRRIVWRNERKLYARQCDLCKKGIISLYNPTSPYTVYCYDCWYSDKWNALDYGQAIDWNRPFFDQFKALQLNVPRLYALMVNNENCEYTNGTQQCKDCYMIFASDHDEKCLYCYGTFNSVQSLDILSSTKCELCYECIGCSNCYAVQYSEDCSNCHSSMFLIDCKGSSDCFMSYGLRNRQYVWENQQLTAEQYQAKLAELKCGSHNTIERLRTVFADLKKKHVFKYYHGQNNEQFSGDYLERCASSYYCFESFGTQNCKYVTHGNQIKDTYDGYMNVDGVELGYELVGAIGAYNVQYGVAYYGGRDCQYMDTTKQVSNSFGCVGLQQQQFCIFNKRYEEAEYHQLKEKLVEHMQQTGEYGDNFPVWCSPFAYNETAAYDMFPLSQADVEGRGWLWYEPAAKEVRYSSYRITDDISKTKDDIMATFLTCEQCKKSYKVVAAELQFYRDQIVPIPRLCFECRHAQRLQHRNPRALWQRQCMCTQPDHQHAGQCNTQFETAYAADNPTILYCEECYNQTVV